jgi:hypothetical protein
VEAIKFVQNIAKKNLRMHFMGFLQRQDKHSTITKIVSFLRTCLRRKLQLYTQRFYFVFELGGEVWNFD